jgi:hypothetical protein
MEDDFLFSYNITNINSAIRKAINRERSNVGRTAYANSVKAILLECVSEEIGSLLSNDLAQFSYGTGHDELKWIDVQQHAAKILNNFKKVVFVTAEEIERRSDIVDEARQGGAEIVVIPSNLRDKIAEQNLTADDYCKVRIFSEFVDERNENFEFEFITVADLSFSERNNWEKVDKLFLIIGGKPANVSELLISNKMQKDDHTFLPSDGLWEPSNSRIIINKSVLQNEQRFIAVLLHELAHAISGATDATRVFESELTRLLGLMGSKALN